MATKRATKTANTSKEVSTPTEGQKTPSAATGSQSAAVHEFMHLFMGKVAGADVRGHVNEYVSLKKLQTIIAETLQGTDFSVYLVPFGAIAHHRQHGTLRTVRYNPENIAQIYGGKMPEKNHPAQNMGSVSTYCRRYALANLTGIILGDRGVDLDGDLESAPTMHTDNRSTVRPRAATAPEVLEQVHRPATQPAATVANPATPAKEKPFSADEFIERTQKQANALTDTQKNPQTFAMAITHLRGVQKKHGIRFPNAHFITAREIVMRAFVPHIGVMPIKSPNKEEADDLITRRFAALVEVEAPTEVLDDEEKYLETALNASYPKKIDAQEAIRAAREAAEKGKEEVDKK